jgi:hypothetical protein
MTLVTFAAQMLPWLVATLTFDRPVVKLSSQDGNVVKRCTSGSYPAEDIAPAYCIFTCRSTYGYYTINILTGYQFRI